MAEGESVRATSDAPEALGSYASLSAGGQGIVLELPARSVTLVAAQRGAADIFADGFESGDTSAWPSGSP